MTHNEIMCSAEMVRRAAVLPEVLPEKESTLVIVGKFMTFVGFVVAVLGIAVIL